MHKRNRALGAHAITSASKHATMALLWALAMLVVLTIGLLFNAKARKTIFIWVSYVSLTGWYYYRHYTKHRGGAAGDKQPLKRESSRKATMPNSSRASMNGGLSITRATASESNLMADELPEATWIERRASENSDRLRSSSASSQSMLNEDTWKKHAPKSDGGGGFLRSFRRRKEQREAEKRRDSGAPMSASSYQFENRASDSNLLSASASDASTTRRTFVKRVDGRIIHCRTEAALDAMWGFDVNKLKPNLKMAVHRIQIVKNKKANATTAARREVAKLLGEGKEEKARIRVEGIIRDDFTLEGYEVIELLCELIAERVHLVKNERECPYDMREAVCTLIWAANRTEIPELAEVKKQLTKKYGQDFAAAAMRNLDGCVNERVIQKLSVQPPSAYLVVNYMKEIAKQFNVEWEPDEAAVVDPLAPIPAPTGASVSVAAASGPDFAAIYASAPPPGKVPSALPSLPSASPMEAYGSSLPPPPQAPYAPPAQSTAPPAAPSNDGVPDFDELTARFERLRRRQDGDSGSTSFSF
ncbi:TPA: hypothetical protein N0F65_012788 [Lagenidium giganteum]|uniref:Uncharacterized protein n=1 Tax=Lagenidium giganteum TaxID=4803 RepID=A0AAV2YGN7_9STRA|nr:TPA: hypothetical protein N0F65_012788 [Lagenidium giganteum]